MAKFAKFYGSYNPQTFNGLSGIGDLMLTAFGKLSRNRTFGFRIAQGEKLNDLISSIGTVEGLYTLRVLYKFGQEKNIELPITRYN